MAPAPPVRLETDRLRLRELGPGDLDFVAAMLGDAQVMEWFGRLYDREAEAGWIRRQQLRYRLQGHGYWLVELRDGGTPVGQAGIMDIPVAGQPEPSLGWILAREHWGRGYATEAAAACRDHVLSSLGRPRAICLIRPGNRRSLAVARRLGMRRVGRMTWADYEHLLLAVNRREGPAPPGAPPPPGSPGPGAGPRSPGGASGPPSPGCRPAPSRPARASAGT